MSDEFIDIVDKFGKPLNTVALKSDAHKNGWYHNTIHLWLYTKNGEILLQQRSHKKAIHPLLWDVSAAGHIDAGESFTEAAIRETNEELGLNLDQEELLKIGVKLHESSYKDGAIQDNEFHHIYIAELTVHIANLSTQIEEVEAIKLVSFTEFEHLLSHSKDNNHFIPSNKDYYLFVLNEIKKKINQ
ncbi:MAG: NUDIX domain-containing protein [Winogradskyella sp.]|uniref:NUDIX hydrolase n=1 Tax=Winogradskyella sp. TaxID=1883156 RepID=UPI0025DCF758|nr:NUDIX domain-containing protein [Winogradskyella sp.]NRB60354.1 NUDIX domain-containing protein [Winogradskyella sp.]